VVPDVNTPLAYPLVVRLVPICGIKVIDENHHDENAHFDS
jgi:hypothetical protein